MRPFKKIRVLSYKQLPYNGFYAYYDTFLPYEFEQIEVDWWGFRKRVMRRKISIPWGFDVEGWVEAKKDKWLNTKYKLL